MIESEQAVSRFIFLSLPFQALAGPAVDAVRPLLEAHCTRCHGAQQRIGGLDFTALAAADTPVRYRRPESVYAPGFGARRSRTGI